VERRKARPADRKAGRLLSREQASRVRFTALCSLLWESDQKTAPSERANQNQDEARAGFGSEIDGARAPGCLKIWIRKEARG
jgi:hypothetical protein